MLQRRQQLNIDSPLLTLGGVPWTIRHSFEGVQIFGASGSGKTSGSGSAFALAMLSAGYGGLVLCAKPGERALWEWYAKQVGRETDLCVIGGGDPPPYRYNFLAQPDHTENVVHLLATIVEIVNGKQSMGGESSFFVQSAQELIRNTVDLLYLGQGTVSLNDIYEVIVSAPQSREEARSKEWETRSFCAKLLLKARDKANKSEREANDFRVCSRYWLGYFAGLADRTRSSIVATFTSTADMLMHGLAWQLFSTDTNITPEVAFSGKIIVLDLPLQRYHDLGKLVQGIWKFCFQRAVLARSVHARTRPVMLWADESQEFIVASFDARYQARARDRRAATVFLAQNISAYYSKMGDHGEVEAHTLLGNLATRIFHANVDTATNVYASDLISDAWQTVASGGNSMNAGGWGTSANGSQQVHKKVLPSVFTSLQRGGGSVEGIIVQNGRVWPTTRDTYALVSFTQQGPRSD